MTPIYKVTMKHTEEVLNDFIKLDNRVRHPMTKVHLTVMGFGFLVLSYLLRENMLAMLVAGGIGLLLLLLLVFRRKIAFIKLAEQDEDYKSQTETEFTFGQSETIINNPSWDSDIRVKYSEFNLLYEDDKNFYICRENQELYLLPRSGFTLGGAEEFREFMEKKTEKNWINTKLPLKERLKRMNEARKLADQLHDEKIRNNKKKK